MKEPPPSRRFEPRWPAALGIILVVVLQSLLSARIRLFPIWAPYILVVMVLVPMAGVELSRGRVLWLRVERVTTLLFIGLTGLGTVAGLANIIHAIISGSTQISGNQLLASAISQWVTNVLVFSLLYWHIDRGSPEARLLAAGRRPDWLFPQQEAPAEDVPPDWRPGYIDYLFLSFSTATAFSTTDTMPMTSRAKMLMMLEAVISLVTITAVAARAINILGG
jgi:uncharacterized membrane protein